MTAPAPEVVCVGETMVALVPEDAGPIRADSRMLLRVGGAESNVAVSLARLGHRAQWVSALGDDPFGTIIREELADAGIDLSPVTLDPDAPTGMFVKDPQGETTNVHYYRRGSAASRMAPSLLTDEVVADARVVHLSGVTPALSDSCLDLSRRLVERPAPGDPLVSFDVNFRPGLWSVEEAAETLLSLARRADIVFVGRDEAETLWGTGSAEDVRALLPEPSVLVVKDAAVEAVAFHSEGIARVAALRVPVVEPVGAGDAFAAGWLSGLLRGLDHTGRLRLGHLIALRAVATVGDCPPIPARAEIDHHLEEKTP